MPSAKKKQARSERKALKQSSEQHADGSNTIRQGDYVLTIHATACYVTLANLYWDTHEQHRLRNKILDIPGVLPSQYSSVSKDEDGTVKLIFSFKKGQTEKVVSDIQALLAAAAAKSSRPAAQSSNRRQRVRDA